MRLATYAQAGETRLGAVLDDRLVDLNRAAAALARSRGEAPATAAALADATLPARTVAFLRLGDAGLATAREALDHVAGLDPGEARRGLLSQPLADATLLPAIPDPPKIVCVARNYADHAREAGRELSPIPIVFARFPTTLVADGDPVVRPTVSEQLDWEGELAVVIGRGGRHISKADALDHVAAYSIFNDVTVRDYQFRVQQYTSGKNFSSSGPFGPFLVTADEVADPHALEITTTVNGEVKQQGSTRDMLYDVPTIIEHISEWIELEPGDVIPTGTPAGVGFSRRPPQFLKPGDVVAVEVTGLGTLTNPIIGEEDLT